MDRRNNRLHTIASDSNLGPVFLGVDYAVFSLSTIVVVIRLFTRGWVTRNFGWDDAVILLTQAITAVGKGFVIMEVGSGLGQHRSALSPEVYMAFLKYYYLDTAQFFVALATCKISICLFLLRFSQFNKLKRILWSLIGFLIISHLALFLLVVFQCKPIRKAWVKDARGTCFSEQLVVNINIVQAVFSFVTDFICAAFPIYLLRNLNIRRQSYLALCFLMGLGVVTGGIAIARTATTYQIRSEDLSWVGVPNAMTRIFEVNLGNIAACVPIMKPFARYVRAKITGKDPHQILQRKTSDTEFHPRWYNRGWRIPGRLPGREVDMEDQYAVDPSCGMRRPRPVESEQKSLDTKSSEATSIALPVQGRCGTPDGDQDSTVPNKRNSRWFRLSEIRPTDFEDLYEIKDVGRV